MTGPLDSAIGTATLAGELLTTTALVGTVWVVTIGMVFTTMEDSIVLRAVAIAVAVVTAETVTAEAAAYNGGGCIIGIATVLLLGVFSGGSPYLANIAKRNVYSHTTDELRMLRAVAEVIPEPATLYYAEWENCPVPHSEKN